jgi:beta-glucosidase
VPDDGSNRTVSPPPVSLPPGFVWGTATAAYQVEGSVAADGRGRSIWDTFCRIPGAVHNGDSGEVACDQYRRVDEDLDLLAELGVSHYRFSVAWPRVQPTGKGRANQPGLDFYRRLVDGLRDRGIAPTVTLYHWDLPQPLEDAGGWAVRETAHRFGEYAAIVAESLGSDVALWITLNEPWCSSWLGYASGRHAPGRRDIAAAAVATHHLLLAHGQGMAALRSVLSDAAVGITLNLAPVWPATAHPADVDAARKVDGNLNRLFAQPVLAGSYPQDMLDHYTPRAPQLADAAADLGVIAAPVDFLGVNFYFPQVVAASGREAEAAAAGYCVPPREDDPVYADLGAVSVHRPGYERTLMGWEIDPAALTRLLVGLRSTYRPVPIYVTENGAAFADYVGPDGAVHDVERISYLDGHVRAVVEARNAGVDVRGYFVWSLLDNFEWAHGYQKRFGLVWVDYPTGTRLPKDSFAWYRALARSGSLPTRA